MKKVYLLAIMLYCLIHQGFAQSPVIKVDFNMSGRSEAEANDPNYLAWIPENKVSFSRAINGVTFTFKKTGNNGTALKADWYKAGVQAPNYARLICDGLIVDGGNAGGEIELTISGLATGTHSLLTFHNAFADPASNTFGPIDVYVNSTLVVNNLAPSKRALTSTTVATSYVTFNATSGKNTVILYKAEPGANASMKNVYINGFELNTPNLKDQSKNPNPVDGDVHINGDNGSTTLQWTAASNAVSHRIYFGTDKNCITTGTTTSTCYKGQQTTASYNVTGLYSMNTYYWRVDEVTASGVVTKGNVWVFRPRQLAFPGAEGYGKYAIGGRGGKVVHVTNLNDAGAGSLRYAVETEKGPRTIVFDVAGIITLKSRLVLSDPYVTVAGQTAPGKGICIRSAPFGFTGNDVIGRHMRLRLGAGATYDGMGLTGANHSILDHCSISWTIDEAFSSRSGKNITLQKTLISEALNAAGHQNYPAGTEHGYAATIGGDIGSFHHNLLAHCYGRNWSLGGGLDGNGYYSGKLDITNNVVYNWGGRATDGGAMEVNFVNNYYKTGAGTKMFYALSIDHEGTGLGMQLAYFAGNVMPGKFDVNNQTAGRRETYSNGDYKKYEGFVTSPFFPSNITTQSASDAYKIVLSDVGASQPQFDAHDIRIVNETKNGTYTYKGSVTGKPGFPDHQNDVGGYESYPSSTRASNWDTDKDGLPDYWETYYGTNKNSASGDFSEANNDSDKNGFTRLEEYLNWMAELHYFLASGATQSINLSDIFRGYTSIPTYKATSVVNGTVTFSGTTATFQPTSCGFASFNLVVTDATGSTMTRKVGVFTESNPTGSCTPNKAPAVAITSPANNVSFTAPATITINATATDADGTVKNVQFFNGTTLLGSDASSPYSFTLTNAAVGTYSITAKATDNIGATTTSSVVTVVVTNALPVVTIISPTNNASFATPTSITINANATDANGTVSNVQFFNGSTLLGSDASAPYSFIWTNVAIGTYSITAKATDNSGATTTSSAITVTVNNPTATLTKHGAGPSTQSVVLGTGIITFSYAWTNANTVSVTGLPAGVTAAINNTAKSVVISGVPTQIGAFAFLVSTIGGNPNATKAGTITVSSGSAAKVVSYNSEEETIILSTVIPNPSSDVFNLKVEKRVESFTIVSNQGLVVYEGGAVEKGETFQLGDRLKNGLYILVLKYADGRTENIKIQKFQ